MSNIFFIYFQEKVAENSRLLSALLASNQQIWAINQKVLEWVEEKKKAKALKDGEDAWVDAPKLHPFYKMPFDDFEELEIFNDDLGTDPEMMHHYVSYS